MKKLPSSQPLSERLRPQRFEDLFLPRLTIKKLQRMRDSHDPLNMVFHAPPGSGKTSAARILLSGWEKEDTRIINGAIDTGIDRIREHVAGFAMSPFRSADLVLCFIDEGDHMSSSAQASLRVIIEERANHCRFILAVNELTKLSQQLRSRLFAVDFSIRATLTGEFRMQVLDEYRRRLAELGIKIRDDVLEDIVTLYFPDFRRIANALEFAIR